MKTDLTEPCSACPFRRQALAGWLGPWRPQELAMSVGREPFPCHRTIKADGAPLVPFDDPAFSKMQSCAGAAIHLANQCKLPNDDYTQEHIQRLKALPNYADLAAGVFKWPHEFIAHHDSAYVKSWEFGDRKA